MKAKLPPLLSGIPDNILDRVNVPLAFVAGAVVMSGVLPDVHPYLKWSIAGLLGSSAAGLTQLATTIIRGGERSWAKRIAVSVAKPRIQGTMK